MIEVKQYTKFDEEGNGEVTINIYRDEKIVKGLSFVDGETEDNTLSRNFDGVFSILRYMKLAYEAGKNGEEMTFEETEEEG